MVKTRLQYKRKRDEYSDSLTDEYDSNQSSEIEEEEEGLVNESDSSESIDYSNNSQYDLDSVLWDDLIHDLRDDQKNVCEMIKSIYMGDFFHTNLITSAIDTARNMTVESTTECLKKFEKIKKHYSYNNLDLVNLVSNMDSTNESQVIDILDHVYGIISHSSDPEYSQSDEYYVYTKELMQKLEKYKNSQSINTTTTTTTTIQSTSDMGIDELRQQCKQLDTTESNKNIIYNCIEKVSSSGNSTEDSLKYRGWLDTVFKIPFGKYATKFCENTDDNNPGNVLSNIRQKLDDNILYMEDAKDKILTMIPNDSITSLALYGEKGTGKSTIGRVIGNALNRPFKMISLGGESDNSVMMGHNMTYVGSKCGSIIDAIIECKCMNPIILIDELDKVHNDSEKGASIYGFLTHLVDSTTNNRFTGDRFLGNLEIDLSKVMFIFTYNDSTLISNILLDRMFKIKIHDYNDVQKKTIVLKSILPKILEKTKQQQRNLDIKFTDEAMNLIIRNRGTGLRSIKHIIEHIISRIQLLLILTDTTYKQVIRLKYNKLYTHYTEQFKTTSVVTVTEHDLCYLLDGFSQDDADQKFNRIKHTMYT